LIGLLAFGFLQMANKWGKSWNSSFKSFGTVVLLPLWECYEKAASFLLHVPVCNARRWQLLIPLRQIQAPKPVNPAGGSSSSNKHYRRKQKQRSRAGSRELTHIKSSNS
jgi:hypothetical protein